MQHSTKKKKGVFHGRVPKNQKPIRVSGTNAGRRSDEVIMTAFYFPNAAQRALLNCQTSSLCLASAAERARECRAIGVFEFATDRHAVGNASRTDIAPPHHLPHVVRGRFAFHSEIRSEHDLLDLAFIEQRLKSM